MKFNFFAVLNFNNFAQQICYCAKNVPLASKKVAREQSLKFILPRLAELFFNP